MEDNSDLSKFLRKLADDLDSNKLVPKELENIGEFYMSYQFKSQALKDDQNNEESLDFNETDLKKFIIMGWYVYTCILLHKSIV